METGVAGCWRVTPCSTLRRLCRAHAVGGSQRAWGQSRDTSGWPQRGAAGLQQTTRDESAAALRAQNAAAWAAWEAQAEAQGAAQRKAAQHVRETLARGAALEAAEAAAARLARQGRGRGRWAGSHVEGEGEASRASGRSSGGRRVEGWGAAGRDERDGERLAALQGGHDADPRAQLWRKVSGLAALADQLAAARGVADPYGVDVRRRAARGGRAAGDAHGAAPAANSAAGAAGPARAAAWDGAQSVQPTGSDEHARDLRQPAEASAGIDRGAAGATPGAAHARRGWGAAQPGRSARASQAQAYPSAAASSGASASWAPADANSRAGASGAAPLAPPGAGHIAPLAAEVGRARRATAAVLGWGGAGGGPGAAGLPGVRKAARRGYQEGAAVAGWGGGPPGAPKVGSWWARPRASERAGVE